MQLAYELLPVWAGQDENLPTAISHLRRGCFRSVVRRTSSVVRPQSTWAGLFKESFLPVGKQSLCHNEMPFVPPSLARPDGRGRPSPHGKRLPSYIAGLVRTR